MQLQMCCESPLWNVLTFLPASWEFYQLETDTALYRVDNGHSVYVGIGKDLLTFLPHLVSYRVLLLNNKVYLHVLFGMPSAHNDLPSRVVLRNASLEKQSVQTMLSCLRADVQILYPRSCFCSYLGSFESVKSQVRTLVDMFGTGSFETDSVTPTPTPVVDRKDVCVQVDMIDVTKEASTGSLDSNVKTLEDQVSKLSRNLNTLMLYSEHQLMLLDHVIKLLDK
jgi:hypothetical protein